VLSQINVNNKSAFIGWFHTQINTKRDGFRDGAISKFDSISSFQKSDKVIRAKPDIFTQNRLSTRTEGIGNSEPKTFLIAGVGSIGSNLIYFLNSMNTPNLKLVDTDLLKIENIGRHLLGFYHLNAYKTQAMKDYLLMLNPLQVIETKEDSIVEVVLNDTDFVKDVDFIFSATGKINIDKWLCNSQTSKAINKPIFLLWVEPHLAGGHCLFLHPNSRNYDSFYSTGDEYKYNVISSSYYASNDNQLSLKEAGCQSTYIPYSIGNVISFLSAMFPKISNIISNEEKESKAFTWIGNLDYIRKMNIGISEFANDKIVGDIIEN
jgi:hypothetical protein